MFLLQSLGIRQYQITVSWQCINDDLRPFVYAHHTIHAFSLIHSCFLLLDLSNVLNSFQPADLQSFKMSMRLSEMHSEGVCLCQLLPEMSVVVRIQNRVHGYKLHGYKYINCMVIKILNQTSRPKLVCLHGARQDYLDLSACLTCKSTFCIYSYVSLALLPT